MVLKASLLSALISFCFICLGQNELTNISYFGENSGNLKMYSYIPNNLEKETEIPLVVVLHGCTQSAEIIANETGWNKLADSLHFMVIYPEQKLINNLSKCFNFFIGFKAKKDKGEVASVKDMIDYMFDNHSVDSNKIFITGMSAGGALSNAMLNAYPEIFNAGALLSAPSNLVEDLNILSKKIPRIAILQGNDDNIVPEKNADKILSQWLSKNHISNTKETTLENYLENTLLTASFYYNAQHDLKIVKVNATNIKHKLLINPGESIKEGGEMDFHTNDINFHSTYWIAQFFGLTSEKLVVK